MRTATFVLVGLFALVGCGSSHHATSASTSPACASWASHAVTAKQWSDGCWVGVTLEAAASQDCADGRTLWWNDWGWGYAGQPAHAHQPGAERVPPKTEREAC